jgi:hypothetical protein
MIQLFGVFVHQLDTFLKKHPKLGRVACLYFDITSRITWFFLINNYVFIPLYVFTIFIISVHFSELHLFIKSLSQIKVHYIPILFNEILSLQLKLMLGFIFFIIDLSIINTLLASTNFVKQYMKNQYGENILKQRGYNTIVNTLKKSGILISGIVLSYGYPSWHDGT